MVRNCYLRLDGIRGISKAPRHLGEIGILDYSWGNQSLHYRSNRGAPGRVNISEVTISKNFDITSQQLHLYYIQGRALSNAKLTVETVLSGGTIKPSMSVEMEDIMIIHIQSGGGLEHVTLNFSNIKYLINN